MWPLMFEQQWTLGGTGFVALEASLSFIHIHHRIIKVVKDH